MRTVIFEHRVSVLQKDETGELQKTEHTIEAGTEVEFGPEEKLFFGGERVKAFPFMYYRRMYFVLERDLNLNEANKENRVETRRMQ